MINILADYITDKDKLIITCRHPHLVKSLYLSHIILHIMEYAINDFDFVNVYSINKIDDINRYKTIIIDGTIFFYKISKYYDNNILSKILEKFNGRVILLSHDIHDWSLSNSFYYDSRKLYPNLEDTKEKKKIKELFNTYKITELIYYYYSPESIYWTKYFDNINKHYLVNHVIHPKLMPASIDFAAKKYDVLFYSSKIQNAYPFRYRLLEICQSMDLKICMIDYNKGIFGKQLYKLISESWLCIATIADKYSYLVQKYFEIPASYSVILGNINGQGERILGNNIVNVKDTYSDNLIRKIIQNNLNDKKGLIKKSINGHNIIMKNHTYANFSDNLVDICDNPDTNLEFKKMEDKIVKN